MKGILGRFLKLFKQGNSSCAISKPKITYTIKVIRANGSEELYVGNNKKIRRVS